jgi:hypothetical protein
MRNGELEWDREITRLEGAAEDECWLIVVENFSDDFVLFLMISAISLRMLDERNLFLSLHLDFDELGIVDRFSASHEDRACDHLAWRVEWLLSLGKNVPVFMLASRVDVSHL